MVVPPLYDPSAIGYVVPDESISLILVQYTTAPLTSVLA